MVDTSIRARTPEELAELTYYRTRLARKDWWYQMSDDSSVYRAGVLDNSELVAMRNRLDPDNAIWNQMAPKEFQR